MYNLIKSLLLIFAFLLPGSAPENPPKTDLHVHLTKTYAPTTDMRYRMASDYSAKTGVTFGIAEEIEDPNVNVNDSYLRDCIKLGRKYPLYVGLQVNQPGWQKFYSKRVLDSLDYIIGDALRFPENGKVIFLWVQGVTIRDPQDFMERYVAYNLKVLSEPINIWVNPTFLPEVLNSRYDALWTGARMKKLIDAAVKNNIAIEINSRYKIPGKKFILMAKAAGAHFTYGSNQHNINIGDIGWSIDIAKECGLTSADFFIPKRKLASK